MFWLEKCPRCKGDLFLESSAYEQSIVCLQCGNRIHEGDSTDHMRVARLKRTRSPRLPRVNKELSAV